jgi:hypothetical protein
MEPAMRAMYRASAVTDVVRQDGLDATECAAVWRPAAAVTRVLLQSNGETGGTFAVEGVGSSNACARKLLRTPQAGDDSLFVDRLTISASRARVAAT